MCKRTRLGKTAADYRTANRTFSHSVHHPHHHRQCEPFPSYTALEQAHLNASAGGDPTGRDTYVILRLSTVSHTITPCQWSEKISQGIVQIRRNVRAMPMEKAEREGVAVQIDAELGLTP